MTAIRATRGVLTLMLSAAIALTAVMGRYDLRFDTQTIRIAPILAGMERFRAWHGSAIARRGTRRG